jgi:hypothetical protein
VVRIRDFGRSAAHEDAHPGQKVAPAPGFVNIRED